MWMNLVYKIYLSTLIALALVSCGEDSSLDAVESPEPSSSSQVSSSSTEANSSSEDNIQSSSSSIKESTINSEDSTITDFRDMRSYKVMKIGKQVWMAENLKYSPEDNPCKKGIDDECLYTWAEAMGCDTIFNHRPRNVEDPGYLQGLCPKGWRVPTEQDAEEMLPILKAMSDTPFDNVFFCNTIYPEDKLTNGDQGLIHDDYCDQFSTQGRRNGFNMHLNAIYNGLWLSEEYRSIGRNSASAITFWEHNISVNQLNSDKSHQYNLRCVMRDSLNVNGVPAGDI